MLSLPTGLAPARAWHEQLRVAYSVLQTAPSTLIDRWMTRSSIDDVNRSKNDV
jgi:hypothetical protein